MAEGNAVIKVEPVERVGPLDEPVVPMDTMENYDEIPTNRLVNDFQWFQRGTGESDEDEDEDDTLPLDMPADAFTAEEIVLILKGKLTKLRELYQDQFENLKDEYKEKRTEYLKSKLKLKKSKVPFTSNPNALMNVQEKGFSDEYVQDQIRRHREKTKLNRYYKISGPRSILHKEAIRTFQDLELQEAETSASDEKKDLAPTAKPELDFGDSNSYYEFCDEVRKLNIAKHKVEPKSTLTCSFRDRYDTTGCHEPVLPLSKFCYLHILEDPKQVLFKPCDRKLGSGARCDHPTLNIVEKLGCALHHMPLVRDLSQGEVKKEIDEKIKALPVLTAHAGTMDVLEDLVTSEANNMAHHESVVKEIINYGPDFTDTDDSEEEEDEIAGYIAGPGYMGIKF